MVVLYLKSPSTCVIKKTSWAIFFIWGYIKDKVCVPPLPTNLEELKIRNKDVVNAMTPDMISNV
jgi:hypothetical protein